MLHLSTKFHQNDKFFNGVDAGEFWKRSSWIQSHFHLRFWMMMSAQGLHLRSFGAGAPRCYCCKISFELTSFEEPIVFHGPWSHQHANRESWVRFSMDSVMAAPGKMPTVKPGSFYWQPPASSQEAAALASDLVSCVWECASCWDGVRISDLSQGEPGFWEDCGKRNLPAIAPTPQF